MKKQIEPTLENNFILAEAISCKIKAELEYKKNLVQNLIDKINTKIIYK